MCLGGIQLGEQREAELRGGWVVKMEEEVLDSQGDAGMDGQKWGTASPS